MAELTLSIIIPVFNEAAVIDELARRLDALLQTLAVPAEVLFVDDGSNDESPARLAALCECDARFKLLVLSRNFGHQAAITAGLDASRGEAVVIMDADLQDPPEVVSEMLGKWREGFDVVYGVRRRRRDESIFKRATAHVFYRLLRAMVGVPVLLDAGDFRLLSRPVVIALGSLRETNRFVRGMVAWVGFRQTAVHYDRQARFAGETHYPLRKMLRLSIDAMTSFSALPLRLAIYLGVGAGVIGIGTAAWAVREALFGHVVTGWTTIMIVVSLSSSAQLLMIGIVGEYVGRIYDEVKRRPLYVVQKSVNFTSQ